jgi:hypothetical protein
VGLGQNCSKFSAEVSCSSCALSPAFSLHSLDLCMMVFRPIAVAFVLQQWARAGRSGLDSDRDTYWLKGESQSQSHGGPCSHPKTPGMVPISLVPSPQVSMFCATQRQCMHLYKHDFDACSKPRSGMQAYVLLYTVRGF